MKKNEKMKILVILKGNLDIRFLNLKLNDFFQKKKIDYFHERLKIHLYFTLFWKKMAKKIISKLVAPQLFLRIENVLDLELCPNHRI